ncbi:hypothetical protein VMCG_09668 [Cytospora schulzeri]|uniref:Uncharacterized protein n=1 Tax=Cytospora schulzeri TaxID=448051 RepID=A0A423VK55_9PEZI|nr:hypothetical protein VMCG_09668 [Valsa malicola]
MADAAIGRRMLGEIEETSLDEILTVLRANLNSTSLHHGSSSTAATGGNSAAQSTSKVKSYPIRDIDHLVTQHFRATQSAPLSLSGRHLPFIYLLVATLVAAPHSKAVVVVDIDAKFDITRVLQCTPHTSPSIHEGTTETAVAPSEATTAQQHKPITVLPGHTEGQATIAPVQRVTLDDLKHIHVYRPARGSPSHIRDVLASAEHHMIYSRHASIAREWWGTVVIGGGSPTVLGSGSADVTTGWKGWLRVDHEEIQGFVVGMSIEEALAERDRRQRAVDEAGWTANCVWGGFRFR